MCSHHPCDMVDGSSPASKLIDPIETGYLPALQCMTALLLRTSFTSAHRIYSLSGYKLHVNCHYMACSHDLELAKVARGA
jgi:hypothetical protein